MEFKDRLKELRIARGYSQISLADALGVSKSTIGAYETGDRKPSYEGQEQIADFFNVSIDYLRGKEDGSMYYLSPEIMPMIHKYNQLNDEGREKVNEYIDILLASGRYIKSHQNELVGA